MGDRRPHRWQGPYFNDEMGAAVGALMAAETMLLGRRTYAEFVAFWPQQGHGGRRCGI